MQKQGGTRMQRAILLITAFSLALAGCGESRWNPLNWFGDSRDDGQVSDVNIDVFQDPRPRAAQITELVVERTPGGAIIYATALMPTQGWFAPELAPASPDGEPVDGVLTFDFRVVPPKEQTGISTDRSREITAGVFVSEITMQRTRVIRVNGAQNSRSVRR